MKKLIAVALLSGFASTAALAADNGMYVVGSLGMTSNVSNVDTSMSFGGLLGYQIDRNFGVEGGYVSLLSKAAIKGLPTGVTGDVSSSGIAVAGTYTFPINNDFSVLGRLGFSSVSTTANASGKVGATPVSVSTSESSSGVLYGVAGQYNINQALALRAGLDFYNLTSNGSSGTAQNLNAAIVYKF